MKFKLEIDCGNAAFEPDAATEVARILVNMCDTTLPFDASGKLWDANGNVVGFFRFEEETP